MEEKSKNMNIYMSDSIKEQLQLEENLLDKSYFVCLAPNEMFQLEREMNLLEFRPKYFLLYNNICEYSIFDSKYLKILKIVSVKKSDCEYITLEFENEEYIGIKCPALINKNLYSDFVLEI